MLPNANNFVNSDAPWPYLISDEREKYKFNIINPDTMDCFLNPQSLGYPCLLPGSCYLKDYTVFLHCLDPLISHYTTLETQKVFVTQLIVRYPHIFNHWAREWNQDYKNNRYNVYNRKEEDFFTFINARLQLTQASGDFFFGDQTGWNILHANHFLHDFVLNGDRQIAAPMLSQYPHVIPALCQEMSFGTLIAYIRTLPPLYDQERMHLLEGDNVMALVMLGKFDTLPIGRTLAPVFEKHKDVASLMVYEAAACGDEAKLKGLLNLTMETKVQKNKHIATIKSASETSDSEVSIKKSKMVHHQDTTEYRETVSYNYIELLNYVVKKFKFTPEDQRSQLFFVQHTKYFIDSIIKIIC